MISGSTYVSRYYTPSTDSFESSATIGSGASPYSGGLLHNGTDAVAFLQTPTERVMGSNYQRCSYYKFVSGTWSLVAQFGAGAQADYALVALTQGSARFHCFYRATNDFRHRSYTDVHIQDTDESIGTLTDNAAWDSLAPCDTTGNHVRGKLHVGGTTRKIATWDEFGSIAGSFALGSTDTLVGSGAQLAQNVNGWLYGTSIALVGNDAVCSVRSDEGTGPSGSWTETEVARITLSGGTKLVGYGPIVMLGPRGLVVLWYTGQSPDTAIRATTVKRREAIPTLLSVGGGMLAIVK
jgi:hypothetical protein